MSPNNSGQKIDSTLSLGIEHQYYNLEYQHSACGTVLPLPPAICSLALVPCGDNSSEAIDSYLFGVPVQKLQGTPSQPHA